MLVWSHIIIVSWFNAAITSAKIAFNFDSQLIIIANNLLNNPHNDMFVLSLLLNK